MLSSSTTFDNSSLDDSHHGLRIGIEPGGQHAAEGLILARYFMFTQVYFHHVRKAFDYHASESLRLLLPGGKMPSPTTSEGRKDFLDLDDWKVNHFIKQGSADRHGVAILTHKHDRRVHETSEVPNPDELKSFYEVFEVLLENEIDAWVGEAENEWYKVNHSEVLIANKSNQPRTVPNATPLSEISDVIGKISESKKRMLFVPFEDTERAKELI